MSTFDVSSRYRRRLLKILPGESESKIVRLSESILQLDDGDIVAAAARYFDVEQVTIYA